MATRASWRRRGAATTVLAAAAPMCLVIPARAAEPSPFTFVDGTLSADTAAFQPFCSDSEESVELHFYVDVYTPTGVLCSEIEAIVITLNEHHPSSNVGSADLSQLDTSALSLDPTVTITMTDGPDRFIGSALDEEVDGRAGDDLFTSTTGGDDVFRLGAGSDQFEACTCDGGQSIDDDELVLVDLGDSVGDSFVWFFDEPDLDLYSYPTPGGGVAIGDWYHPLQVVASGAEQIHIAALDSATYDGTPSTQSWQLFDTDVDFEYAVVDTRGLDFQAYFGPRAGWVVDVDGFQGVEVYPPAQERIFIYNGRYFWLIPTLYQQLLGRDADDGGFGFWYDQLWDGLPHAAMVDSMLRLPEHATLTVDQEYQHILGRAPDAGGRAYWASYLGAGGSPDNLRSLLYGSPEYLFRAGSTTDAFLDALYRDVLGRAPDAGGRAYWRGLVDSGRLTRSGMALVVLGLDEPLAVALTRLYGTLLGRAPSGSELGFWIPTWRRIGEFGVLATIAGSDEYYEHVAPLDPAHSHYFTDGSAAAAAATSPAARAARFDHPVTLLDAEVAGA